MIIINPAQNWYHDDLEISRNREYDPRINRRIINEDDGFAVTTLTTCTTRINSYQTSIRRTPIRVSFTAII